MPRPKKSDAQRETQNTLNEAGVYAAKLVRDMLKGTTRKTPKSSLVKMPRVSASKIQAAKIAIEHSVGLPKAKILLKTNALTMRDIAEIAQGFGENVDESAQNLPEIDTESDDVLTIPIKPLTKRQLKERARN